MSAIGADPDSPAEYGRTKAAGERAAQSAFPEANIIRPSVVFGPDDDFFNRFATLARFSAGIAGVRHQVPAGLCRRRRRGVHGRSERPLHRGEAL